MREFTMDDLRTLLRRCAGQDESIDLEGDLIGQSFAELGYDSLALLELSVRLSDEYGVRVEDGEVERLLSPADVLELVNARLAVS
ncbi:acyl carrier protein [Nonomuraea glycinis]|uniref:acyl carrier protein n=1 Tax=Nonomuraea glycinis TaxID=2047744 RepID=UPI0033B81FE3